MISRAYTVAFEGVDARQVEVQCAITPGLPGFSIVGLPDKSVSEARDRVRAALNALEVALPSSRITVNLSPADLPKEGSHFDLPIALALLVAIGALPADAVESNVALGELSLDGSLVPVLGALPAAFAAAEQERGLICPAGCGEEAAWIDATRVIAAQNLNDILSHMQGRQIIHAARPGQIAPPPDARDLRDVKGQERAKRALEIAAAGRHHLLLTGTPGSGKSMLAARLPGLLPDLTPAEALESSMIHSLAGLLQGGGIARHRPFRAPHHTASMPAIVGGGRGSKPGEISLAHHGVLFLDELPEFPRSVLETLRQPLETGEVTVSRANAHVRYPCRFLLIAAANPCKCGYLPDPSRACARVPDCGLDYMGRISGPLMDRFDLRLETPPVAFTDLDLPPSGDSSATVRARVAQARTLQEKRFQNHPNMALNADAEGRVLDDIAAPDTEGRDLMLRAAEKFGLTARGYHRVLRVARTIADLDHSLEVRAPHIAEALSYRLTVERRNDRAA
jgi:magnesium chelatase family protein